MNEAGPGRGKYKNEVLANSQRAADLSTRAALDALRARETRDADARVGPGDVSPAGNLLLGCGDRGDLDFGGR